MPPKYKKCCVLSCPTNEKTTEEQTGLSFHKFPKNEALKDKWILLSGRNLPWDPKTKQLCSLHFKEEDFLRDLRYELIGGIQKIKLKDDVVPTLQLPLVEEENQDSLELDPLNIKYGIKNETEEEEIFTINLTDSFEDDISQRNVEENSSSYMTLDLETDSFFEDKCKSHSEVNSLFAHNEISNLEESVDVNYKHLYDVLIKENHDLHSKVIKLQNENRICRRKIKLLDDQLRRYQSKVT